MLLKFLLLAIFLVASVWGVSEEKNPRRILAPDSEEGTRTRSRTTRRNKKKDDYDYNFNWSEEEDFPEIEWVSNEFPHQASIRYGHEHFCTGSIISNRWILTVASCFDNDRNETELAVFVGSSSIEHNDNSFPVKEVIIHPRFVPRNLDYDVAVLRTRAMPMIPGIIAPIQMIGGQREIAFHFEVELIGWLRQNNRIPSDTSQMAIYKTMPQTICQSAWWNNTSPRMLCGMGTYKDLEGCRPDLGAPLIHANLVFGIYSWGPSNCGVDMPHIFTNLTNTEIRGFIRRHTGI